MCITCQVLDPGEEVAVESRGIEVSADGVRASVALRRLDAGAGDGGVLGAARTRFCCPSLQGIRMSVHGSGEHAGAPLRVMWAGCRAVCPC